MKHTQDKLKSGKLIQNIVGDLLAVAIGIIFALFFCVAMMP
jgi:hypothetical protein